ncbi:MAG: hypothetical protein C4321_02985, partial [Chloroflexota bacterium]
MRDASLGPLLTAHLRDDQFFPVRGHYGSTWRGSFKHAGGGTLIEHSIHDVDVFRWLFGDIAAVRCHTREATPGHPGVEDVALVTFQHVGGHQTTLTSVWHGLDDRPSTRFLEVFFEGGYFATEHDFSGPDPRAGPKRAGSRAGRGRGFRTVRGARRVGRGLGGAGEGGDDGGCGVFAVRGDEGAGVPRFSHGASGASGGGCVLRERERRSGDRARIARPFSYRCWLCLGADAHLPIDTDRLRWAGFGP